MNKFNIGDKVKVISDGIKEKHKEIYEIRNILFSEDGYFYKVGNIPNWACENDIVKVD